MLPQRNSIVDPCAICQLDRMMRDVLSSQDAGRRYALLTEACDRLLRDRNAHRSWLATPFLHVISGHPATYGQYAGITGGDAQRRWTERSFGQALLHIRNIMNGTREPTAVVPERCDVLLVGPLVSEHHLEQPADFYFGHLQAELAARGIKSLLLLRNHTRLPVAALRVRAARNGATARAMLPDAIPNRGELEILLEVIAGGRKMSKLSALDGTAFQRTVGHASVSHIVSAATTASLRVERQIEAICRTATPTAILVTFEGHAWERCVWRGARRASPGIVCAGYQHTIMRKSSYAMRRSLGCNADPDLLLCMGEFARDELAQERWLADKPVRVLGTHRYDVTTMKPAKPVRRAVCLVLPEGIREETDILFRFALDAAAQLSGIQFILRSHPILSPKRILDGLVSNGKLPANVMVSEGRPLSDDLARSGSMLYRGSSTALYGVLCGLRPFYLERPGEMTLDPLYKLDGWRVVVDSVAAFGRAQAEDESLGDEARLTTWLAAASACRRYAVPEQAHCIDWLARVCRSAGGLSTGAVAPGRTDHKAG